MRTAEELEAQLRSELEQDKAHLRYQRQEFDSREQALLEREANMAEAVIAMVESEKASHQHDKNVALAQRIAQIRLGDAPHPVPTPAEVEAALEHFGATSDVFRLCWSVVERPNSDIALALLYRASTESSEESAKRQAREAAIQRLISEEREAEYAAQRELAERLER